MLLWGSGVFWVPFYLLVAVSVGCASQLRCIGALGFGRCCLAPLKSGSLVWRVSSR